ncbi:EboA domain-containing protein [Streptomyces sp. XM4193]|uniref:EboA domain-containing protein n=1 Tax=Streptomyces sp. XM4193 TaxID=2929782 RepID=UPI001FF78343|nr:EboA domain-containing protein [Streptomyces sp. XM4193]MCK1797266.1 EboA domain-containing protein [Streptomyces sp. XM4193]
MTAADRDRLGALRSELDERAQDWFERALAEPDRLEISFAAAKRACGAPHAVRVRVALLVEHRPPAERLAELYRRGNAAERLAVLEALPELPPDTDGSELVHDALRTNDPRLVAAALGPYGARCLAPHDWRQAVLKCLFVGIPLAEVHDLAARAAGDDELARMLRDFAAERTAAGRTVPEDLHRLLELAAHPVPAHPAPDHPATGRPVADHSVTDHPATGRSTTAPSLVDGPAAPQPTAPGEQRPTGQEI